jgi:hypothetical protein
VAGNANAPLGDEGQAHLPDFEIEITKQGWITDEPYSVEADLCSHGDIRLVIGGRVISPGDGSGEYTISTSALALLRTLESDHSHQRSDGNLILHCGEILMCSCPIGIDWSVAHGNGRVHLSDVVRSDSVSDDDVTFPAPAVDLAEDEYRHKIVTFAEKAKEPFVGIEKALNDKDDWEREMYTEFWLEYEERLARARALANG